MKNVNKNTYRNIIITSIIAAILITSGIGVAYAADTEHTGTLIVGETSGGNINRASGINSAAFGSSTTASGINSAAFGSSTTASNEYSAAFGAITTASGSGSAAFGWSTTASGHGSASFGDSTTASGRASAAFGFDTTAQSYSSFVLGRYNEISGTTGSWVATDPLFVIGNGASAASPSNAVTILKNGNVGIGVSSPDSALQVSGYIQLDTSSGTPPSADCDASSEYGRMIVDSTALSIKLYVCTPSGWDIK